jgi:hypothetical protein
MDRLPRMRPTSPDPSRSAREPRPPPMINRGGDRVVAPAAAIWIVGYCAHWAAFFLFERVPHERLPPYPSGIRLYRLVALADLALRLCTYVPIAWIIVCSWKRYPKSALVVLVAVLPALVVDSATRMSMGWRQNTSNLSWFVYSRLLYGFGQLIDDFLPVVGFSVGLLSVLLSICLRRLRGP